MMFHGITRFGVGASSIVRRGLLTASAPRFSAASAPPAAPASPGPDSSLIKPYEHMLPDELAQKRVLSIAEDVLQLRLIEITVLGKILRTRLGLPADFTPSLNFGGGGGGGGGAAAPAAAAPVEEPEPAAPVKTIADLQLVKYPTDAKIKLVKEARTLNSALGLKEAKELVESAPCILASAMPMAEAEEWKKKLTDVRLPSFPSPTCRSFSMARSVSRISTPLYYPSFTPDGCRGRSPVSVLVARVMPSVWNCIVHWSFKKHYPHNDAAVARDG